MAPKDRLTLDPHEAALRGRIGGFSKAAKHPADQLTTAARRGFMARFEPSEEGLDDNERRRRTEAALKAHMAKLAYLSSKARGRRINGHSGQEPKATPLHTNKVS